MKWKSIDSYCKTRKESYWGSCQKKEKIVVLYAHFGLIGPTSVVRNSSYGMENLENRKTQRVHRPGPISTFVVSVRQPTV